MWYSMLKVLVVVSARVADMKLEGDLLYMMI